MISDIHANYDALTAVLESISDFDLMVCLGDLVGYGAQPNEVIEEIRRLNPEIVVAGNHDYATVSGDTSNFVTHASRAINWTRNELRPENLDFLSKLPPQSINNLADVVVASYHGSPRDPLNEYVYPGAPLNVLQALLEEANANLLLLGHTHVPFHSTLSKGAVTNPGSVGQPRDGNPSASYAKLDILNGKIKCEIERISYDVESAASRIVECGLPTFLAERLFIGV